MPVLSIGYFTLKICNVKTGEIFIYKQIGDSWWSSGVSADQFQKDFSALEATCDLIKVRINSPGGSIFDGVAIYNLIAQSKKEVHTYIDGIAYSMAAIIALAGKKVFMARNATKLIHACSGVAIGNVRDMKNTINMMEAIDTGLSETISEKTGLTVAEVQAKWMNYDDHTLTAQQALDAKLIDEIVSTRPEANVPDNISDLTQEQLFAFYSDKENSASDKKSFLSTIVSHVREALAEKPKTESKMNFSKLKTALASIKDGKLELTADDITALNGEIDTALSNGEIFTQADIDNAKKEGNDALVIAQNKINELEADNKKLKGATDTTEPVRTTPETPVATANDEFLTEYDKEAQARYEASK